MRIRIKRFGPARVAIFVDTSTSWGRGVIAGIHSYVRLSQPWHIFIEDSGQDEYLRLPEGWEGDGIIARVSTTEMVRAIRKRKIPTVNVSGISLPSVRFPTVCTNLRDSGQAAAEHLLERGFRHFGYFTLPARPYVIRQKEAFLDAVERAGFTCSSYQPTRACRRLSGWTLEAAHLAGWIATLPKPVAIFTANASSGRHIIHACQFAGWSVPEDVAVLSGSDDELLCEVSNIPMSGVAAATEQIGYRAAALLDQLMQGQRVSLKPVVIPPRGVITRQSTDTLAVKDPIVVKAVRFIRENAHRPIQVGDVLDHVRVSRRILERKFTQMLGRTPAREIYWAHLERAKHLLVENNMPIPMVAGASGFNSPEHMIQIFTKKTGITPLQYQNRFGPKSRSIPTALR